MCRYVPTIFNKLSATSFNVGLVSRSRTIFKNWSFNYTLSENTYEWKSNKFQFQFQNAKITCNLPETDLAWKKKWPIGLKQYYLILCTYLAQILRIKIRDTKMCATLNLVIWLFKHWGEFGKEKKTPKGQVLELRYQIVKCSCVFGPILVPKTHIGHILFTSKSVQTQKLPNSQHYNPRFLYF